MQIEHSFSCFTTARPSAYARPLAARQLSVFHYTPSSYSRHSPVSISSFHSIIWYNIITFYIISIIIIIQIVVPDRVKQNADKNDTEKMMKKKRENAFHFMPAIILLF